MLTTKETAAQLGVTHGRVRQMVAEGMIEAEKRGRDLFIAQSDIEKFIRHRRKRGRPKKAAGK